MGHKNNTGNLMTPLQRSTLLLVIVNLLPVGGVLFLGWSVFEILLLFWAENLIIGAFNVARMRTLLKRCDAKSMYFLIPFFCMHYGIFTIVHLVFVLAMFAPGEGEAAAAPLRELLLPLLALTVSHAVSYYSNFIGQREYERVTEQELMAAPYGRVMVLHITIIVGGFVITLLGEPVYALVLLVLLKIGIDVASHRRSHERRQRAEVLARTSASGQQAERDPVFRGWSNSDAGESADNNKRE